LTRRYKLSVEYDGRNFMGWQRQASDPTVQATLEAAVERICQEQAVVQSAGRTDAGVHARAMVAHVDLAKEIDPFRLQQGLNWAIRQPGASSGSVAVLDVALAPPDFHARFSATQRRYEYRIINRRAPLALEAGLAWHVPVKLDANAMHEAAQLLLGTHDFTTFRSAHCQAKSPIKSLEKFSVSRYGPEIVIEVAARSFLHHQVRSMVGCLKLVGEGKWTARRLQKILEARDRNQLGFNAPPEGLYFVGVDYESSNPA
jgi:tRNA pseudouridine38-40 synthase